MSTAPEKLLLNRREAAALLGRKSSTLRAWCVRGIGPQVTRLGDLPQSRVAYTKEDLLAWLRAGCPMHPAHPSGIPGGTRSGGARGARGRFVAELKLAGDAS